MFFFRRGTGRLTPDQAHTHTDDGTAVLLDVRETPEWKAGHAPGAVHLSLSRLAAGAALPPDVRDRPVVAICRSGNRSQQAAKLLVSRGVDAVDVTGGMKAWAEAGLPVVDERGQGGRIA
ncbi:rhodanese-like domain-containing protein (plasmid) [Streptomyces sp. NA03103]|uniref:rhodanese-like domain-containing protein n=1 Tax=Streptomyces TaxID=1883 RepID=UPI0015908A74|nr:MULTISPECIES: rhodanese-like domain-containing protein [Streptomyces]MCQ4200379.1 rhodanese-like domain-containing protein [Streptomyces coelicoflavus]QKW65987.1 rhodanese-like domain-containing protein [Streptomyces sp. NA03103]